MRQVNAKLFAAGALLVTSTASIIGGCGANRSSSQTSSPATLIVAVDATVPGDSAREQQAIELSSLAKSASESHTAIALWSYGSNSRKLFGPDGLADSDQLDGILQRGVPPSQKSSVGTARPDLFFSGLSADPTIAPANNVRVIILGSGTFDATHVGPKLQSAGKMLASSHPLWRLDILGVPADNAVAWRQWLGPAFGQRLELLDPKQASSLLSQNRDM